MLLVGHVAFPFSDCVKNNPFKETECDPPFPATDREARGLRYEMEMSLSTPPPALARKITEETLHKINKSKNEKTG